MPGWISRNDIKDGSMGPVLRGVDADGNPVEILEHPVSAVDTAEFNFLVLREIEGHRTEHFTLSIPRGTAGLFFYRVVSLLAKKDPELVADFCDLFGKTLGQHEETPNGDDL